MASIQQRRAAVMTTVTLLLGAKLTVEYVQNYDAKKGVSAIMPGHDARGFSSVGRALD